MDCTAKFVFRAATTFMELIHSWKNNQNKMWNMEVVMSENVSHAEISSQTQLFGGDRGGFTCVGNLDVSPPPVSVEA